MEKIIQKLQKRIVYNSLGMGKQVKIYDFAQKLVKRFGDGRSSVIVSGLRAGEKLYEELLTSSFSPFQPSNFLLSNING